MSYPRLTIAVFSYDGRLFWGLNADYDRLPAIADFAAMIRNAFVRLADAAGVRLEGGRPLELMSGEPGAGSSETGTPTDIHRGAHPD